MVLILQMIVIYGTLSKMMILLDVFFIIFIFWVVRGVKGGKNDP